MMSKNEAITKVLVEFNQPEEVSPIEVIGIRNSKDNVEEVIEERRFSSTVEPINEESAKMYRRIFSYVNRARLISINLRKKDIDIPLSLLKQRTLEALTNEILPQPFLRLVENEIYYIWKKTDLELVNTPSETMSVTFIESKTHNKCFTLNYEKDKIYFEGCDLVLKLRNKFPTLQDGESFYLNLCTSNLDKFDNVFLNVYFNVKKNRRVV